jgi:mannosyltransferase
MQLPSTDDSAGSGLVSQRRQFCLLLLLVIVALGLRLYRINWESSWLDENFTLRLLYGPFDRMMQAIVRDAVHPPLHYILMWGWVRLFGFDQIQTRLFSTLVGVLCVPLIFLVGRRLLNPRTALIAAGLMVVSQFAVHYSQEGRMYSLSLLLVLCALLFFVRMLQERKIRDWLLFLTFSILMLYTSYYAGFILPALAIFVLVCRREYPLPRLWLIATPLILAVAILPWFTSGIIPAFLNRGLLFGDPGYMRFNWATHPITTMNWFNSGKWNGFNIQSPLWTFPAGGLLFTVPALAALWPIQRWLPFTRVVKQVPGVWLLLLLLWVAPLLLAFLISATMTLQFQVRYVICALPGYLLLVAVGLDCIGPRRLRWLALAATVLYSTGSLYAIYTVRSKADYRTAARFVAGRYQQGDCLCFLPRPNQVSPPGYWEVHARALKDRPTIAVENLGNGVLPCNRVWFLWDRWIRDRHPELTRQRVAAFARNNVIRDQWNFFQLDVVLYAPR